jgi:hypothetical protein
MRLCFSPAAPPWSRPRPTLLYQDALTVRKFAVIENSLPRSQRCDGHRRRGIEVNLLRLTHELARRRRYILGVAATIRAEITINLIVGYKIFDARPARTASPTRTSAADGLHRPGHLAAKNQRRLQAEDVSQSVADFPIDRIYRCRSHFYQQLIFSRLGPFHLRELHDLFISVQLDPHCFHDFLLSLFRLNLPSSTRLQFREPANDNSTTNAAVPEDNAQSKRFIAVFAGCSTVEFHLAS